LNSHKYAKKSSPNKSNIEPYLSDIIGATSVYDLQCSICYSWSFCLCFL